MTLYIRFLLLLILPLRIAMGQVQDHAVHRFTTKHGLQYGILKIGQDRNGFIWLMGDNEIQRFDGKHTDIWFKGEKPYSLLVDSRGDVWVTTSKGIFRFDNQSARFSEIAVETADTSAKIVFEPRRGQLTCISTSGIYVYDEASKEFILSSTSSHRLKPKARVAALTFSHLNHTLYYCAGDTIWRHDMQTGKADKTVFQRIHNVLALSETEIIVSSREKSTSSWYYNFSTGHRIRLFVPGTDIFLHIYDAMAVDKKNYYLATSRGLVVYSPGAANLRPIPLAFEGKSLSIQKYYGLYKGKKGRIWACTRSSLLCFNPFGEHINFIQKNVTEPTYWFSHDVRSFAEDERGNLWMATHDGLTYWDMKHNRFSTIRAEENATDRLNHATVNGLVYDGNHLIIGQANNGIWLYHPKTKIFKRPVFENSEKGWLIREKVEKAFIHEIKTLKNGDHIIAAGGYGAYLINGDNYTIEAIDFPEENPHIEFAYQDTKGDIFIGTFRRGLYCFDGSLRYQYQIKQQLDNYWIRSLLAVDGGYYIGTEKGLYFFSKDQDSIAVKKVIPALQEYSIRTLFEDNDNTIWIVSESKLHRYFPETGYLSTYGYSENIRGNFFHPNSYIRKSDGQVFIGSENGIHYFYPEKIDVYPEQFYPYIREITIREFTDSINTSKTIRSLKRHQNTISIRFSTPYYGNPNDITYRYQLTKNGQWFNHGNQSDLTLWKLPSGDYQFRVAATLYDGIWHTSENSFRFTIPPPFWKTWWFSLAMVLLGGMILYNTFIYFQRKLKTEKLLNVFATSLYGHNTVDDILWETAKNCAIQLGFTDCVIYEMDKKKRFLIQKATADIKNSSDSTMIDAMKIPVGKGIIGAVAASGKPARVRNTEKAPKYITDNEKAGSEIAVPIWIDGELFGVIDSEHPKRNFYKRHHTHLLEKVADICAERIRKYLTEEKLREKIARDLHDEMGSTLTSIHIISEMTEQDLKENIPAKKQLSKIKSHTSDMMEKMSDMVWVVNPANDGLDKLMYRIREYAVEVLEPQQINLSFQEVADAKYITLNPEQRKNIYLIAKETLNNAVKYSDASKVGITFKEKHSLLEMHIRDDGKGYDTSIQHSGNGIKNMRVRSEEIGAILQIETAPGKGVSLLLSLTVEKKQSV